MDSEDKFKAITMIGILTTTIVAILGGVSCEKEKLNLIEKCINSGKTIDECKKAFNS